MQIPLRWSHLRVQWVKISIHLISRHHQASWLNWLQFFWITSAISIMSGSAPASSMDNSSGLQRNWSALVHSTSRHLDVDCRFLRGLSCSTIFWSWHLPWDACSPQALSCISWLLLVGSPSSATSAAFYQAGLTSEEGVRASEAPVTGLVSFPALWISLSWLPFLVFSSCHSC